MVKTIALPAGSEEVLIRNIPRLLTDATYPQMPEDYKVIGCLQKREVPDVTPDAEWENISWETLTEGDRVTLNRIWEDSGLPPYRNKMCMSEWLWDVSGATSSDCYVSVGRSWRTTAKPDTR